MYNLKEKNSHLDHAHFKFEAKYLEQQINKDLGHWL